MVIFLPNYNTSWRAKKPVGRQLIGCCYFSERQKVTREWREKVENQSVVISARSAFVGFSPLHQIADNRFPFRFWFFRINENIIFFAVLYPQTAVDNNAYPYIAWKSNSRATDKPNNELWNKMYHYYALNKDKFLERYHQRSNSETCFSMVNAKFGGTLKSKTRVAQINEALCKILCHNLCAIITSMHECGKVLEQWKTIKLLFI